MPVTHGVASSSLVAPASLGKEGCVSIFLFFVLERATPVASYTRAKLTFVCLAEVLKRLCYI